ncbi:MAG: tRNA (guanosine(46)-N7)-methyltransferase TrmB [Pseudomonadales bacterium]
MSTSEQAASHPDSSDRRTYIRRRGRMTRGQARALAMLQERYCIDPDAGLLDVPALFQRNAPLGLEIGFGMGHALLDWARERPDWNLLGSEIYEPGVGAALLGLQREGLDNVRLVAAPAEQLLERQLACGALDEVRIFFPDPWPKQRHHKRRLLQPQFVRTLTERMKVDATLWVATDWEAYAEWIVAVLDAQPGLTRLAEPRVTDAATAAAAESVHGRPRTRFETRGIKLGHRTWDLRYVRNRSSTPSR